MVTRLAVVLFMLWPAAGWAQNLSSAANDTLRRMFTQVGSFGPPPHASDPFTCNATTKRTTYYNTVSDTILFCNGTTWGALGASVEGAGTNSIAIGTGATATATDCTGVGEGTVCASVGGVAVGSDANTGTGAGNVVLGDGAAGSGTANARSIAIGFGAAVGAFAVAVGGDGACALNEGVAIGSAAQSTCSVNRCNAIGTGTVCSNQGNLVLGYGATDAGATDTFVAGGNAEPLLNVFFGKGVTNAAAVFYHIRGTGGTGTDNAGGAVGLAGGVGTGTGAPGDVTITTGTALATGTTVQTLVARHHIEGSMTALVDATATVVFTVSTGNDVSCGGTFFFCVEAADAANQQSTCGSANFAAADNAAGAGGEACDADISGTNSSALTSGTLTVTADGVDGGTDVCNIRLTATGSLTETVGPRARWSAILNPTSSAACTITPQ